MAPEHPALHPPATAGRAAIPPALWREGLVALADFVRARGHARVPARTIAHSVPLGRWVTAQRLAHWDGTLTAEQITQLQAYPGWDWGPSPYPDFDTGLAHLQRYLGRHRTTLVQPTVVVGRVRLGGWVAVQRARYTAGTLPAEDALALQALPGWSWTPGSDTWDQTYAQAARYAQERPDAGIAAVTSDTTADGLALAAWIRRQREAYRTGQLTPQRVAALDELPGWVSDPENQAWRHGLAVLRRYVAQHGDATVPQKERLEGFALGVWVNSRRKERKAGTLSRERTQTLEALPGWTWQPQEAQWRRAYAYLQDFTRTHGSATPQADDVVEAFRVGQWAEQQRRTQRANRLTLERVKALEQLPGWTWLPPG